MTLVVLVELVEVELLLVLVLLVLLLLVEVDSVRRLVANFHESCGGRVFFNVYRNTVFILDALQ